MDSSSLGLKVYLKWNFIFWPLCTFSKAGSEVLPLILKKSKCFSFKKICMWICQQGFDSLPLFIVISRYLIIPIKELIVMKSKCTAFKSHLRRYPLFLYQRRQIFSMDTILQCVKELYMFEYTYKGTYCFDIHALFSNASSGVPPLFLKKSMCFLNCAMASRGALCWKDNRQICK